MKRFVLFAVLLIISCRATDNDIREKAIYYKSLNPTWHGPATSVIENFCLENYRLPKSVDELIPFIESSCAILGSDNVYFGDGPILIEDLRKASGRFAYFGDSCFFYTLEYSGNIEGVSAYSLEYQLDNLNKKNIEERISFEASLVPRAYDKNNHPIYIENEEILQLEKSLKEICRKRKVTAVRLDISPKWPYRTIYRFKAQEGLSFYKLNLKDSLIRAYNLESNCYIPNAIFDYSMLDPLIGDMEDILSKFVKQHSNIEEIKYYAPLCW